MRLKLQIFNISLRTLSHLRLMLFTDLNPAQLRIMILINKKMIWRFNFDLLALKSMVLVIDGWSPSARLKRFRSFDLFITFVCIDS